METPKEQFIALLRKTGREGIEDLIAYLDSPDSDWFTAPASSRFHGAYPGGLVDHSLAVWNEFVRLYQAYQDKVNISYESMAIMALLHDLCKINTYIPTEKSRKTAAGWEKYQGYDKHEEYLFGGHGSKSVFIASRFIKLTDEEAAAINCHMATWEDGRTYVTSEVYHKYPAAWMLHAADEAATFIIKLSLIHI